MNLQRCSNGHFYDAEKYPNGCPHCASQINGGQTIGLNMPGSMPGSQNLGPGPQNMGPGGGPGFPGMGPGPQNMGPGGGPGFRPTNQGPQFGPGSPHLGDERTTAAPQVPPMNQPPISSPVNRPGIGQPSNNPLFPLPPNSRPIDTEDDGKTEAYWGEPDEDVQTGTASEPAAAPKAATVPRKLSGDLVVGWLVCVSGSNYGKSFELRLGKNFVGRSDIMDVCLAGDNTVARQKHAIIIYEPRQRKFFAQPGESHELFYINDEVVLTSRELQRRDVIIVGRTKLIFIPLCDETFSWDSVGSEV